MEMLIIVGDEIHDQALAKARAIPLVPAAGGRGGLNAPLPDEARQWFDRIWDTTEAALLRARRQGKEAAEGFVTKVETLLEEASAALKDRFQLLRDRLLERLSEYMTALIDAALKLVRPTLSVGGLMLPVRSVTVEQRLMLSGSVKASLQEIIESIA